MKSIAIALGFKGKLYKNIFKAFHILEKNFDIKYMSRGHCLPHITTISGKIKNNNIKKIYEALNKINLKKFKLKSPGMGIFANANPNLHIRWEQSLKLKITTNIINKKTSKFFQNINQDSSNSLWVPKTSIAYMDLHYSELDNVFKKTNFLFNSHFAIIKYIYLIDYTFQEEILYTIKLK